MPGKKYTWLKDYSAPTYQQECVSLEFFLSPRLTTLKSKLFFKPNKGRHSDLVLCGEDIRLNYLKINGRKIENKKVIFKRGLLIIPQDLLGSGDFHLEMENDLNPETNKSLEGLYLSDGVLVTQCEAEGFRKICYCLDRPDVLSRYRVKIHGSYNHLLSNGNPVKISKNYSEWYDPVPKPSYLFALVAGDLVFEEGEFRTTTGRKITIRVFHKKEHLGKTSHALNCIKRAMAWDEVNYGREYDLDIFMVVAIDDFNAGAMENKGLNIFNSKYILYDEALSTDADYKLIEAIIAHEYFHNWTGNRITCRDWFQLCLKEGLTVLREQEYIESRFDKGVSRIDQIDYLFQHQFKEDAGPLSHAVRPTKYQEINNFYTATVYEKSAEIIRMLKTIIGREKFLEGMDLFFKLYDGVACTLEDFQQTFETILKEKLTRFFRWYHQSGTPKLLVSETYCNNLYCVTLIQENRRKKGRHSNKVIPITIKVLNRKGKFLKAEKTLVLDKKKLTIEMTSQDEKPIISLLNSFSAPVLVEFNQPINDLFTIMEHETDYPSIWLAKKKLDYIALEKIASNSSDRESIIERIVQILIKKVKKKGLLSKLLQLPDDNEYFSKLLENNNTADPYIIKQNLSIYYDLYKKYFKEFSVSYFKSFIDRELYQRKYSDHEDRALACALIFLNRDTSFLDNSFDVIFNNSDNMSLMISCLINFISNTDRNKNINKFYLKYGHDKILLNKWFSSQVQYSSPKMAIDRLHKLTNHKDFKMLNPNNFNSLIGTFAKRNFQSFHQKDGSGYKIIAEWIKKIDPANPQIAASTTKAFAQIRFLPPPYRENAKEALEILPYGQKLSKDTSEILDKIKTF